MSYQNDKKKLQEIVYNHFKDTIPERIRRLSVICNYDLYFGPIPPDNNFENDGFNWPGYCAAMDEIQPWIESNIPSDLWVDIDCESVMEKEPEGYYEIDDDTEEEEYIEPFLDFTYHIDSLKEIAMMVFPEQVIKHMY